MVDYYQQTADAVGITREQAKKVHMFRPYMGSAPKDPAPMYFFAYFIGGNWQIGKMRDGKWQLGSTPDDDVHIYGGSHAGARVIKMFRSIDARRTFMNRMVEIYGERFYCRGDDPSEQRFFHKVDGAWIV